MGLIEMITKMSGLFRLLVLTSPIYAAIKLNPSGGGCCHSVTVKEAGPEFASLNGEYYLEDSNEEKPEPVCIDGCIYKRLGDDDEYCFKENFSAGAKTKPKSCPASTSSSYGVSPSTTTEPASTSSSPGVSPSTTTEPASTSSSPPEVSTSTTTEPPSTSSSPPKVSTSTTTEPPR